MDVKATDVCIVHGYRLTKYQIFDGNEIMDTYFNIRDDQGVVHGSNYDDVEEPLEILLNMCTTGEVPLLSA